MKKTAIHDFSGSWLKYLLAIAGIAILIVYKTCPGSCSFLSGTLAGIDLTVFGVLLMVGYAGLLMMKQETWAFRLLAMAIGGEFFLIGYQCVNQVFCPYCLGYAAIVILLFLLHFEQVRKWMTAALVLAGFSLFLIGFSGQLFPSYAAETPPQIELMPAYGDGAIEVRLYTDYFCGPCQALEKELDALLPQLIQNEKLKIVFVDTPMYKYSGLYARYFLYALAGSQNNFERSRKLKQLFFKAAKEEVYGEAALKNYLAFSGIEYVDVDLMPTLTEYSRLIKEDRINATPRMVVVNNGEKESYSGAKDIFEKLKVLL